MKFRKNIRLKAYNYTSNGAYFVTICCNHKKSLIGERERLIIEEELTELERRFKGVKVDYRSAVKNHIHFILIFENASAGLPRVIQAFKSITTKRCKEFGYEGKIFWQRNYYEHVIRNEKALLKIREYIQNNPLLERLNLKEVYGG